MSSQSEKVPEFKAVKLQLHLNHNRSDLMLEIRQILSLLAVQPKVVARQV